MNTCPWCLAPLKETAFSRALICQCTNCTFEEVIEIAEPEVRFQPTAPRVFLRGFYLEWGLFVNDKAPTVGALSRVC